jgi:arabinoxylan arabinofuranohydrolase
MNLNKTMLCQLGFMLALKLTGQNPIVPSGIYIADPSAHQWKNGKMYVYGSRDESPDYYCSSSYVVLSSVDLHAWTISGPSFVSQGPGDQVPYAEGPLYAPDVQFLNGKYYLYYCMPARFTEGVAVSEKPEGPFLSGKPIHLKNLEGIDPCVFIDDDGQGYYVWGQFHARMAKLKPNMTEIDTLTIVDNVVGQEKHFFHEGSYMIKHNGLYYLIYADISRKGRPTCLGYSTSTAPMGPYTYRGVIIDNDGCDPEVWNNHGSLASFNGKWYVFYHRATNGSVTMRKACVEPITFTEDGSIPEVEMTTQGAGGPLDPFVEIDAARACLLSGHVRIKTMEGGNEMLGEIHSGDKAVYKYLDFKAGADTLVMRLSQGSYPCRISLSLDYAWGSTVAEVNVPPSDNRDTRIVKVPVKEISGVHALIMNFTIPALTNASGFSISGNKETASTFCTVDAFWFQ